MAYLILLAGVVLLGINIVSWKRLTRSITQDAHRAATPNIPREYLRAIVQEWRTYALGDGSWRGRRGLIIALLTLLAMLFINAWWLKFTLGFFLPTMLVILFVAQIRIGRSLHHKAFEATFPEVLSVVGSAVSAGNSIHQALHRCGEDVAGELGETFNRIDRRLNLGEEPDRVFLDAWRRYPYREFYFFVMVIQISIQRGGQLRTLINRLARIINNSKKMAKRKKAMTSEARTSAKIVAAMPILFLFGMKYLNPENFDFVIHDPVGRLILYYVIGSEIIGMLIIWLLLKRAT
ncbi:Flp pilus assembly protein TadB [Paramixta manurensis]|uniref:Flp pilus assembly protein TadB n=1 Tax=Paramixta manurensis TaxID=2740817 RepID=A0A6M8ULH1_9GAMM|nr:Flp pilus assembly protein TadB [Erwiniaceae bacterium PD-1]